MTDNKFDTPVELVQFWWDHKDEPGELARLLYDGRVSNCSVSASHSPVLGTWKDYTLAPRKFFGMTVEECWVNYNRNTTKRGWVWTDPSRHIGLKCIGGGWSRKHFVEKLEAGSFAYDPPPEPTSVEDRFYAVDRTFEAIERRLDALEDES